MIIIEQHNQYRYCEDNQYHYYNIVGSQKSHIVGTFIDINDVQYKNMSPDQLAHILINDKTIWQLGQIISIENSDAQQFEQQIQDDQEEYYRQQLQKMRQSPIYVVTFTASNGTPSYILRFTKSDKRDDGKIYSNGYPLSSDEVYYKVTFDLRKATRFDFVDGVATVQKMNRNKKRNHSKYQLYNTQTHKIESINEKKV